MPMCAPTDAGRGMNEAVQHHIGSVSDVANQLSCITIEAAADQHGVVAQPIRHEAGDSLQPVVAVPVPLEDEQGLSDQSDTPPPGRHQSVGASTSSVAAAPVPTSVSANKTGASDASGAKYGRPTEQGASARVLLGGKAGGKAAGAAKVGATGVDCKEVSEEGQPLKDEVASEGDAVGATAALSRGPAPTAAVERRGGTGDGSSMQGVAQPAAQKPRARGMLPRPAHPQRPAVPARSMRTPAPFAPPPGGKHVPGQAFGQEDLSNWLVGAAYSPPGGAAAPMAGAWHMAFPGYPPSPYECGMLYPGVPGAAPTSHMMVAPSGVAGPLPEMVPPGGFWPGPAGGAYYLPQHAPYMAPMPWLPSEDDGAGAWTGYPPGAPPRPPPPPRETPGFDSWRYGVLDMYRCRACGWVHSMPLNVPPSGCPSMLCAGGLRQRASR